jgi:FAD/FMN-containing dehydrogenase
VSIIRPFALNGDALFAIRGAGQQPVPGCSSISSNGITIDLRFLTGINVKDGVVEIGAGQRWGPVYEKLSDQGLGVTGSRSALGGIGELSLAGNSNFFLCILLPLASDSALLTPACPLGGLSFFSSREGFICDNVVNYELVLSTGDVVNANATENADLWRALRSEGNNFGIVTRFDIRIFEQGHFWGGAVFYFPSSFPDQIQRIATN